MMLRPLAVAIVLASTVGPAAAQTVDLAAEEAAVRARSAEIVAAEDEKNVDAAVAFYLEDAIVQAPDAPPVNGRAAIRDFYTQMVTIPYTDLSSDPVDIQVAASGDMAFEHGINRLTLPSPDGGSVTEVGKYLLVWKKVDGEWRIAALSFSMDEPAETSALGAIAP